MAFEVDRELDWKMRSFGHAALIIAAVFFLAVALDGPRLLWITVPLGAAVLALDLVRLRRDKRAVGVAADYDVTGKRRRRAWVLAIVVGLLPIAYLADSFASPAVSERYWYLFVTPLMLAITVGPIALLMLGWTYLPRREDDAGPHPT